MKRGLAAVELGSSFRERKEWVQQHEDDKENIDE
jgi:hypothetical protein